MKTIRILLIVSFIWLGSDIHAQAQLPPPPPDDHDSNDNFPMGGGAPIGGGAGILILLSSAYGFYRWKLIERKEKE